MALLIHVNVDNYPCCPFLMKVLFQGTELVQNLFLRCLDTPHDIATIRRGNFSIFDDEFLQ